MLSQEIVRETVAPTDVTVRVKGEPSGYIHLNAQSRVLHGLFAKHCLTRLSERTGREEPVLEKGPNGIQLFSLSPDLVQAFRNYRLSGPFNGKLSLVHQGIPDFTWIRACTLDEGISISYQGLWATDQQKVFKSSLEDLLKQIYKSFLTTTEVTYEFILRETR